MTTDTEPRDRAPDLQLAGFRLWVDGRHPAEVADYWDGNWVVVHAEYRSANAAVTVSGPFVHLSEIVALHKGCTRLAARQSQEAGLYCQEPNLKIELWAVPGDQFIGKVRITPDHKSEMHDFGFAFEAAELDALIGACAALLVRYPLRHAPAS